MTAAGSAAAHPAATATEPGTPGRLANSTSSTTSSTNYAGTDESGRLQRAGGML